jgi:hypothetical protein
MPKLTLAARCFPIRLPNKTTTHDRHSQDTSSKCPKESYANVCYTPKGLAYYSDWGTLRNTGNMMFLVRIVLLGHACKCSCCMNTAFMMTLCFVV